MKIVKHLAMSICLISLTGLNYAKDLTEWQKKNNHLIPDKIELKAILSLDQDGDGVSGAADDDIDEDGILNNDDDDIDGDGVKNILDPSPYDWREIGYNPFGMLVFLNWDHTWNGSMYDEEGVETAAEMLKEMGVGFIRMDFSWDDIEPSDNDYDFEKYDMIVQHLLENDIRILGIFSYCSCWAGKCWNNPPDKNEYFVEYMGKTIDRYKNFIKYWEIWNEPDSRIYWKSQDRMKRYTELLKDCYREAKKIDKSCKVLMGGVTENCHIPIKHIYTNGGKDYFDIVNIHPFVNPLKKERFQILRGKLIAVKKVMKKFRDENKPIWITELGCPGVEDPTVENGWWHGMSPTEEEQADWVEEVYTKVIELTSVDKVFWAFFQDTYDHFHNGVDYFGLVRGDFSKKPGFESYRKLNADRHLFK